jgi:hypothetical protein
MKYKIAKYFEIDPEISDGILGYVEERDMGYFRVNQNGVVEELEIEECGDSIRGYWYKPIWNDVSSKYRVEWITQE